MLESSRGLIFVRMSGELAGWLLAGWLGARVPGCVRPSVTAFLGLLEVWPSPPSVAAFLGFLETLQERWLEGYLYDAFRSFFVPRIWLILVLSTSNLFDTKWVHIKHYGLIIGGPNFW